MVAFRHKKSKYAGTVPQAIIVGATPLKNVFTSKASTLTNVIGAAGVISAQTGNVISLISSGSKAGSL